MDKVRVGTLKTRDSGDISMSASPLEVARSQEKLPVASERHGQALSPEVLSTILTYSVEDASPVHMYFLFFFSRGSQNRLSLLTLSIPKSQRLEVESRVKGKVLCYGTSTRKQGS